jgi:hypothetical protein
VTLGLVGGCRAAWRRRQCLQGGCGVALDVAAAFRGRCAYRNACRPFRVILSRGVSSRLASKVSPTLMGFAGPFVVTGR